MAWITITVETLKTRNAGAEVTALQESSLADGQSDPIPDIIAMVVDEVRGYCAAGNVTLAEGNTVPDRLLLHAINRIRYEAATRLPGGVLLDDDRRNSNAAAVRVFERVADRKFVVEAAVVADSETNAAVTTPSAASEDPPQGARQFTRDDQDGI
jgi:hypothetical protein